MIPRGKSQPPRLNLEELEIRRASPAEPANEMMPSVSNLTEKCPDMTYSQRHKVNSDIT